MDLQKENNLIQEAFEVEADEIGFCLDQKWGDYENPYESSDTALAFNLFERGWQAAKAQAIPEGFVVVPRKSIEHWYLDEGECLWMDEPDNWLCDMDVGDVQEVEHKEYIVTESNTLYATKVWDGKNQNVSSWEFFNSKDDAEKAAEYCNAMIEAQEQTND